ncbi:multiple cyclophane-containing RiPP AmcA [Micromonospora sp. NPDC047707]|uniref:multiple cyclophane-containing RiPP AmcA n=1 Tax=Micromonospora sp. NPDC047707 TaxID=3154498 RepID=UPI00345120F0
MTLYVSRNAAIPRRTGAGQPASAHQVRAIGRAEIPRTEPPLLTHAWRRIFAEAMTDVAPGPPEPRSPPQPAVAATVREVRPPSVTAGQGDPRNPRRNR